MKLNDELITAFAKITNDDKDKNTETILYGTTVIKNGIRYVQIDGSSALTPVQSTAVIRSGARVTIMLKDHQAIVTGNLTDPSASSGDVNDLGDVETALNSKVSITEFENTINELLDTIASLTKRIEALEKPEGGTTS